MEGDGCDQESSVGSEKKQQAGFGKDRGKNRERHQAQTDEIHQSGCAEKFAESELQRGEPSDALKIERLLCFFFIDAGKACDAAAGCENQSLRADYDLQQLHGPAAVASARHNRL